MKHNFDRTININLWAGPGIGKSTIASEVFARLKRLKVPCELVREYAKDLAWEDKLFSTEQFWISAEQHKRQEIMQGKTLVLISDTALPTGIVHADIEYQEELEKILMNLFNRWESLNFFLKRNFDDHYEKYGRQENQKIAEEKHLVIERLAERFCPNLIKVETDVATEIITQELFKKIKKLENSNEWVSIKT